jgi:hypothetical protein
MRKEAMSMLDVCKESMADLAARMLESLRIHYRGIPANEEDDRLPIQTVDNLPVMRLGDSDTGLWGKETALDKDGTFPLLFSHFLTHCVFLCCRLCACVRLYVPSS